MNPSDLLKAGRLDESIVAVGEQLRRDPTDKKSRTFLFELLCFSGDYVRAEKQLDILAQGNPQAEMGALFYRGALNAMKAREDFFLEKKYAKHSSQDQLTANPQGTINGSHFNTLSDADFRVGANLEVFAAGSYLLVPFSLLSSVEIGSPRRFRDLLWIPAVLRTAPAFQGKDLGETLLPALNPFSAKHLTDSVRLGRETVWDEAEEGHAYPVGQKILVADGEEVPILEIRKLEFLAEPPPS